MSRPHPNMWQIVNVRVVEGVDKIDRSKFCHHCSNDGWVILDGEYEVDGLTYAEAAAPCPMCVLGLKLAISHYGEDGRPGYWSRHNIESVSWNHGASVDHAMRCSGCGGPARRQPCHLCQRAKEITKDDRAAVTRITGGKVA